MAKPQYGQRSKSRRRTGYRRHHLRVLVVCGAAETEPQYFQYVKERLGASGVSITIKELGDSPRDVLIEAVRLRDDERIRAAERGDSSNMFDSVWIVVDVDEYGRQIPQLFLDAKREGIKVALSNPCFEFWLALHSSWNGGYLSIDDAQSWAKREGVVGGKRNKDLRIGHIEGQFESAEERAKRARKAHKDAGRRVTENPSTRADLLVRSLIDAESRRRPGFQHGL